MALLKVPSALVPFSSKMLLNPVHADAARIRIVEAMEVRHDDRILVLLSRDRRANG